MISTEEYVQLGCGSVLVFECKRGPLFRTVLIGPQDHVEPNDHCGILLPIIHRSWTRRIYTCMGLNDLRQRGNVEVYTKRRRDLMSKEEISRLLDWIKPSEGIQREIKEGRLHKWANTLRDPLTLCKKMRELRNNLRWASI